MVTELQLQLGKWGTNDKLWILLYRYIFWFDNGNGGSSMILGFILMFGIAMILCVGFILANGTQDFIDEQNEKIRKDNNAK